MKYFEILVVFIFLESAVSFGNNLNFHRRRVTRNTCSKGEIQGAEGTSCCPEFVSDGYTQWACIEFLSKCIGICKENSSLPTGETVFTIFCKAGQWTYKGESHHGQQVCQKEGDANAKIPTEFSETTPDKDVTEGRRGKELPENTVNTDKNIENKSTCKPPPEPKSTNLYCKQNRCLAECIDSNHKFWNGKDILHFECINGLWKLEETSDKFDRILPGCSKTRSSVTESGLTPVYDVPPSKPHDIPGQLGGCKSVVVKKSATVGLIKIKHHKKGWCTNDIELDNFINCEGTCDSFVYYNGKNNGINSSKCQCCQASRFSSSNIILKCDYGKLRTQYFKPVSCICGPCKASFIPTTTPAPPFTTPKVGCPERHCGKNVV